MSDPTQPRISVLINERQIRERVAELAHEVTADFGSEELVVVGILKGSWVFLADLVRLLPMAVVIDFMTVSSYGDSTRTSGVVKIVTDLKSPLAGRNVLLVEDILDSGLTLEYIRRNLLTRGPARLKVCVLLDKPSRRKVDVKVDYVGFEVPDRFVVGYGADHAERFRNLPYVGYIEEEGDAGPQG